MRIVRDYILKSFQSKEKSNLHGTQVTEYSKVQLFTNNQLTRYGYYRRSDFKKDKIKKIISNFNPFLKNINPADSLVISVKSITKHFVGELVEISRQIVYEKKDSVKWKKTPIFPFHIQESITRYRPQLYIYW